MPAWFRKLTFILLLLVGFSQVIQAAHADFDIVVSAIVPANASNFPNSIASTNMGAFAQNDTATYTITYGSNISSTTAFMLEAKWSEGTISGNSTPTVDVVDYVPGSATNAYGGAVPVIDTVNRKISWTITSFPAHDTTEVVSFTLKANNSYQGMSDVNFSVASDVIGPGVVTADSTVNQLYHFQIPAPGPTNTLKPGVATSPTPTPTETTKAPRISQELISSVSIEALSDTQARISVITNKATTASLTYGTDLGALTNTSADSSFTEVHRYALSGLSPKTTYYFRVIVTDAAGNRTQSEIYTFHTATGPTGVGVDLQSLIVISNNQVLLKGNTASPSATGSPYVIVPTATQFGFSFGLVHPEQVKSVQAQIVCPDQTANVSLLEPTTNEYTGQLVSPRIPERCQLVVRITDTMGNIIEQPLTAIQVTNPLTVSNLSTKKPIEHAKVQFWIFDEKSKKFVLLTTQNTSIDNPGYSDTNGIVHASLQSGIYKVIVSAVGYQTRIVTFTLGIGSTTGYPQVGLQARGLNFFTSLGYYGDILMQGVMNLWHAFNTVSNSWRAFDLFGIVTVILFFILTLLGFARRIHLPVVLLPAYLLYHLRLLLVHGSESQLLQGKVLDYESGNAVSSVHITSMNQSGRIIGQTLTNRYGEFRLTIPHGYEFFTIAAVKRGYHAAVLKDMKEFRHTIEISIVREEGVIEHIFFRFADSLYQLTGSLFETFLALSILFEVFFGIRTHFATTLPFLILSVCNLGLWIYYQMQLQRS